MKVLMLSIGHPSANGLVNETVSRHLDYAKAIDGQIHLICYAPGLVNTGDMHFDERFFVYNAGAANMISYPWEAYKRAVSLLKIHSVDLIYTQDPFGTALVAGWLKKRFKLPVIVGNHSSFMDNPYWLQERPVLFRIFKRVAQYNLRKADALKSVSKEEKENYVRLLNIDPERIYVQSTPLKTEVFARSVAPSVITQKRMELGVQKGETLLIWVGRPVKPKRILWMLTAFAALIQKRPSVKLLLIGNKRELSDKEVVERFLQQVPVMERLIWLENGVPNHELPAYYQAADIYVHTSSYEGLCKTILEASASGLPVVTTRFSGLDQSMQEGKTGFIVPVEDQEAWVNAIIELTDHPDLARQMGEEGQRFVKEHFHYETGVANLTEKWKRVVQQYKDKKSICVV